MLKRGEEDRKKARLKVNEQAKKLSKRKVNSLHFLYFKKLKT